MKLVFATHNEGKLREASDILGPGFELVSARQAGVAADIEETGSTLRENSLIKADYLYKLCGADCFADDTGLEVDALDGAPGVYTARYAGEGCDFEANMDKLLSELAKCPEKGRKARFRCVVTLILKGERHFFDGVLEGSIALERSGCKGFGYDPVFVPDCFPDKTLADLGEEVKNGISHRYVALNAMRAFIQSRGPEGL